MKVLGYWPWFGIEILRVAYLTLLGISIAPVEADFIDISIPNGFAWDRPTTA